MSLDKLDGDKLFVQVKAKADGGHKESLTVLCGAYNGKTLLRVAQETMELQADGSLQTIYIDMVISDIKKELTDIKTYFWTSEATPIDQADRFACN